MSEKKEDESHMVSNLTAIAVVIALLIVGILIGISIKKDDYLNGQIDYASGQNKIVEKFENKEGIVKWIKIEKD